MWFTENPWPPMLLFGVGALILFRFAQQRLQKKYLIAGIVMLLLTFFIGQNNGTFASLWLNIGGFSFQPIEMAKLTTIIFLASIFASKKNAANTLDGGFIPFAVLFGIPAIISSMKHISEELGIWKGVQVLNKMNQKEGDEMTDKDQIAEKEEALLVKVQ